MVYHEYFDRPFIGWVLRSMRAIPIASSGGPKMILQAFREAGKALDAGEHRLHLSGGPAHANRLDGAVSAGARADRQGADHADHPGASGPAEPQHLQPGESPAAAGAAAVPGDDLVRAAAAARRSLFEMRQAIRELDTKRGHYRKDDRPAAASWVHSPGAKAPAAAGALPISGRPAFRSSRRWPGSIAIARALAAAWQGQTNVGILLPASVGGRLPTWRRRWPARRS